MIEDGSVACEIEVRMIGKINDGRPVSCRPVLDLQLILVGKSVDNGDREISRKPLLAVFADVTEREDDAILAFEFGRLPDDFVEPLEPTVQGIFAVVLG